ncbi:ankyrin repeat domain-containing protein [Wolbachia endosymbiont of Psylliodes chrysocephala]|uniref:ankyrin repeat domain-containing protein n=1 Tax=Wolbachia endosymbiont of Psylliodes chrysocephala TaxID=2883236 RepID=UPI00209F4850|nr:ankyrin repeat domain-containing protein [Wolbachia endosymbiont of Psylliodes chrysocephala]
MAIEKEKFFEIIRNVSESEGLNKDNLLERIRNELRNKDYAEYDKFNYGFSKEHQFSIKISDKIEDWTLLHLAVACDDLLTVTLLLEKKVSVKTRVKDGSNDGPTAFDIATSNSNQEIVQLLRKANPQLEKNKDKTSRDIIIKTNKTPEGLVVNGNNAAAAPANVISPYLKQHDATRNDKQTSVTGESSDSTADKQRQSVKDMIKNFELPQRRNTTCSGKQTSTSLNESGNSDDSGICTESEDGEDIDAKNEELKKLEKELAESKSCIAEHKTKLKESNEENESLKQKMQELGNENTELKDKLDKTESQHSKTEVLLEKAQKELAELRSYFTGHGARLDTLNEENESLKQKMQELGNENTKLKGELEKTKTKKNEVPLEKAQKELTELRNCVTEHETKLEVLEKLNKENESLTQKIKSLESENATLKGELGKTKTKTNEVSLEKVGKRQFSPRVAYASLAAMLVVGVLSIAFGLSALLIVAASVVSALIAGGITCTMSKPSAEPKPATELEGAGIQGLANGVCKT